MSQDEDDEVPVAERRICWSCVGEAYLKAEIKRDGHVRRCYYCNTHHKSITIDDLAYRIHAVIEEHYYITATEPEGIEWTMVKEGGEWERAGEPVGDVIADLAGIDEDPAEDVRQVLEDATYDHYRAKVMEEAPYDSETYYAEVPIEDYELREQWRYFQRSLQSEARMFNRGAWVTLDEIFEGLAAHRTRSGDPVLVAAGPGTEIDALYRARVFQSVGALQEALKHPDRELGPPPSRAARAGRMNAQGIAVFYGATAPHVALAETRPPVGSSVLIGRFEIVRPLQLLDVRAFGALTVKGSLFNSSYHGTLKKAKFLQFLSQQMTRPVMPDDEPYDYLVTQAIAEYLASLSEPVLDGIIYRSVQSDTEVNVVLFHKSARVEELDIPEGSELSAQTHGMDEDGPYPDYTVWEEVPPLPAPEDEPNEEKDHFRGVMSFLSMPDYPPADFDDRAPALRVDIEAIEVRVVSAAEFRTSNHHVSRHRMVKAKLKGQKF